MQGVPVSAAALCIRGQLVLRLPDSPVPASHLATESTNHATASGCYVGSGDGTQSVLSPPGHLAAQEDF